MSCYFLLQGIFLTQGLNQHLLKQSSLCLGKTFLLITENRHLKLMVLVLSCDWEDARIWGHWDSSWEMQLTLEEGAIYPKLIVP